MIWEGGGKGGEIKQRFLTLFLSDSWVPAALAAAAGSSH